MATIERHNPEGLSKLRVSLYNHCVRVSGTGTTLYLAGQLARDADGRTVGVGDIRAQTEQVILNMQKILRAEGGDLQNLVKVTVFVTDVRYRPEFRAVRDEFFGTKGPASTMIEVSKLAHPDYLIEVEAVAVV